jgi:D-arginine dehydrogenase
VSDFDVAIIGGGIAGVSLAQALAGRARILLLEAEAHAGAHATGRSAAVFVPKYGDALIRRLSAASRDFFDAPPEGLTQAPLLKPRGMLRLIREPGREDYENRMAGAPGIEDISLAEARTLLPILKPERFVAASREDDVHDIEVEALLQGCLKLARRAGADIRLGTPVTAIAPDVDGWRITAGDVAFTSTCLVNAAGAWADQVAPLAGVRPLGLRVTRRSMAFLEPDRRHSGLDDWPFTVCFPLDFYLKPDAGRLLVSPGDEDPCDPHDAYTDDMVIAEGLHRFTRAMDWDLHRIGGSWAGLRCFAPDEHPVIGFDPHAPGFFWLAGQGGFGVQTAPGIARLAASLMLGTNVPDRLDGIVAAVSPGRLRH